MIHNVTLCVQTFVDLWPSHIHAILHVYIWAMSTISFSHSTEIIVKVKMFHITLHCNDKQCGQIGQFDECVCVCFDETAYLSGYG